MSFGRQHNENAVTLNVNTIGNIPRFGNVKWAAVPANGDARAIYVEVADALDSGALLGYLLEEAKAATEPSRTTGNSLRTFNSDGSLVGVASAAIAAGAEIAPADGGKWATGAGGYIALTAATQDGDYFSYVRKG